MGILGSMAVLVDFILGIYMWMVLIRVLLSWVNPDPYNPLVQSLVRATEPVLAKFRQWVPAFGGIDLSPVAALLSIQLLQKFLAGLLQRGGGGLNAFLVELLTVIHLLLTFYLLMLLARAGFHIYSWYSFRKSRPMGINLRHPLTRFIFQVTEPTTRPVRQWIPTFSGLDVTPLAVALVLILILTVLQNLILGLSVTTPMIQ